MMGKRNAIQIDSSHYRAICDEIGERLQFILAREASPMPLRLQQLLDRLAEQDVLPAPPTAPSIDDMAWPLEPATTSGKLMDAA